MRISLRRPTIALAATALLLALSAAAPLAPRAGAVTFGANLNRAADSPYRCGDLLIFPQAITCSAQSINLSTGESAFPPVGVGVVTQVRVKVGPVTGPMQIVVEEALRQDNPSSPGNPTYACCKAINASQVFTPATNSVTTVNVNLPVRQDIAPDPNSGLYVDDHLSLSVLNPNVPIPANLDNNPNNSLGLWYPAWQVGQERADQYGFGPGGVILFNAEWNAAPGADQSAIEFARRNIVVRNNNAFLPLICNLGIPCDGTVRLQNLTARLLRLDPGADWTRKTLTGDRVLAKRAPVTYGKRKLSIKAGKKKTIKVPLGRKGKRLFRDRKKVKVWANFKLKDVAESALPSTRIKLKEKN